MKSLVSIFTHDGNVEYFRECLRYSLRAINTVANQTRVFRKGFGQETRISLMVIDFSPEPSGAVKDICKEFHTSRIPGFVFVERPGAGFCDNMNYSLDEAQLRDYDILFEINDDSMVHNAFFSNALDYAIYHPNCSFLGGVPQENGKWNDSLKHCYIPVPEDKTEEITNFCRLWWEMSACAINLGKIGPIRFDVQFDDWMGVVGDNDFLLRVVQNRPNSLIRSYSMRFWHARGITQQKFGRNPMQSIDIHKIEAVRYFKAKWGVDIGNMNEIITIDQCYKIAFNGELINAGGVLKNPVLETY